MRNAPLQVVLLASMLLVPVAEAQPRPIRSQPEGGTVRATAEEAVAEGQWLLARRTAADIIAARQRFERAVATDPNFAPGFAGLAEVRALLYDYSGAQEAAQQAVTLDDGLASAHAVLGFVRLHKDWNWSGAEAELKRALELDPGRATVHLWRGIVLETTGRTDEAVAAARRAVELAPDQANIRAGLGFRLFWAARYDEAIKELEAALKMDPNYGTAHYFIGRARVEQRRYLPAQTAFDRARRISPKDPNLISAQGYLYARIGRRDAALRVLGELERLAADDQPFASQIAALNLALGNKDIAIEWLKRSYLAHEGALLWVKIDPRFEALRGETGFVEILRKMGLERGAVEEEQSR